jgi:hypothetical protein
MTIGGNLADLERHACDFAERTGFTYTVLDAADDVVGCVYIYPARGDEHDAHVRSWARTSRAELDSVLRDAIAVWLERDWPFERVLYARG